ncbi:alpha/beta fold hydrolase [Actinacidiphila yeochonensis]|uniref:alpha/beta hydrolase n=1 Tax=Actinacidiphila yeochonensis TaxID=89050 RepID=UPI00068B7C44|nr:alpha/beta hydrolase [Actinacidiphila yeochonensis]
MGETGTVSDTVQYTDHHAPEGLTVRGTVLVVPGRGESAATYQRLGRRLAADAYHVRVVPPPDLAAGPLDVALDGFGAALAAAAETAGPAGPARPLAVLGADTGALATAALLAGVRPPAELRPEAVVLAGLPGRAGTTAPAGGWEEELDLRTACPTHRRTLTEDADVRRGALGAPVPEALLAAVYDGAPDVPALLLAGDADPLADQDALGRWAAELPRARFSVVRGGHHDVLNDVQHRSVAAEIVTFLETVRDGLVPVVTVASSTW